MDASDHQPQDHQPLDDDRIKRWDIDLTGTLGLDATRYKAVVCVVPVDLIDKAPWNFKHDEADRMETLVRQFRQSGQIINCIIRRKPGGRYELVDGNHRRDVFDVLNQPMAFCIELFQRASGEPITRDEAQRIASEIVIEFDIDPLAFGEVIASLSLVYGVDELSATSPFSEEQLEFYMGMNTFDFSDATPTPEAPVDEGTSTQRFRCSDEEMGYINRAIERMVTTGRSFDNRRSIKYGQVFSLLARYYLDRTGTEKGGET